MQNNRPTIHRGNDNRSMDEMPMSSEQTENEEPNLKISIIGVPGAGKTTQSRILANTLGMLHVSSGDLVRQYLTDPHTTDELAVGHLAPNEEAVQDLVRSAICNTNRYILDGFPRMIDQIETGGIEIDAVVYLDTKDSVAVDRLLHRKRPDDTPEVIESRLGVYYKLTHPVLEYFRLKSIPILTINGNNSRGLVWASIVASLDELTQPSANA